MQVLSQQIIHQNRCLVLSLAGTVWKIPISPLTWAEAGLEKNIIGEVTKDAHFSKYLPSYKFLLNIATTAYMKNLAKIGRQEYEMNNYFKQAFFQNSQWPISTLYSLPDIRHFEDFVKGYLPDQLQFWKEILEKLAVRKSSSHGDFHMEHIMVDSERLYFIDWVLYSVNSSRYFDLINFWIFSQKTAGEPWMEIWKKYVAEPPVEIHGIQISAPNFQAYAIWKVAVEVKLLKMRNRLNEQKQRKYLNFILYLGTVLKS